MRLYTMISHLKHISHRNLSYVKQWTINNAKGIISAAAQCYRILDFRKMNISRRASSKYVKCPKKDSVLKVSLESDLLFSVEI